MHVRHLESFLVLADQLHFGRSAAMLGISQSALSQQLQRLEDEVGVQLVVRTSREVTLTEAGVMLLEPARAVIASVDRADAVVSDFREGRSGRVVVGSLGAGLNGPLADIIRGFRTSHPSSSIELRHTRDGVPQERALLAGELDVAIVRRVVEDRLIDSVRLLVEPFVVYVPSDHALAGRVSIDLAELAAETFVLWPRRLGAAFYDLVVDACRAAGFTPIVGSQGDTLEAQLALVAAGCGVSIQASTNGSISRPGVRCVPLRREDLQVGLWCAWRRGAVSPVVRSFLDSALAYAGQGSSAG
jgi:DNA-binding transcriptional LysR family regulator